jgi:dimethylaniline monooxygenase (N-oxide forming)
MEATPVIGSQVLSLIECGKIETKPNIARINENSVEFEDGSVEEVDTIIFCTGYLIENPFMTDPSVMGSEDEPNRVQLYKHVFSTTRPGICFIGMVKPNGSILPVSELQARWASQVFAGKQTLPSLKEMRDLTALDWQEHLKLYLPTDRMSIAVDQVEYMDFLADCIGAKPDLWKLWKTNWTLALRVTFGPVVSAQYRLGEWDGAEKAIEAACRDVDFKTLVAKKEP